MSSFHTILGIYCSIKTFCYILNKTIRSIHIKDDPFLSATAAADTLNLLTQWYVGVNPNSWSVLITPLLYPIEAKANCNVQKGIREDTGYYMVY